MSQIYFIADGAAIKIGRSEMVGERFRSLETGNPNHLELIACIDGGPGHEKAIHAELKPHRLRGEWFADCHPVRDAIARYQRDGAPLSRINTKAHPVTFENADPKNVAAALISLTDDPQRLERLDDELAALRSQRKHLERMVNRTKTPAAQEES